MDKPHAIRDRNNMEYMTAKSFQTTLNRSIADFLREERRGNASKKKDLQL